MINANHARRRKRTAPSVTELKRVERVLEADPSVRPHLGPKVSMVRKRGGDAVYFSAETVAVAEALMAQKLSPERESVRTILRIAAEQGNRKTEEGEDHPDRDAQFRHINKEVRLALAQEWPVISVDTKKKELVGNFANKGRQWRRQKTAEQVNGHDFADASVPRAYPYGIYIWGRTPA